MAKGKKSYVARTNLREAKTIESIPSSSPHRIATNELPHKTAASATKEFPRRESSFTMYLQKGFLLKNISSSEKTIFPTF